MANNTSITSPGVQVNEIDASTRPVSPAGTSVLAMGFANQGPTDEVFAINSMSEFELTYGKPTNPAERYFYQTARSVFQSNARLFAARLPYGVGGGLGVGEDYTALFYPVVPFALSDGSVAGNIARESGGTSNQSQTTLLSAASGALGGLSLSATPGDVRTDIDANRGIDDGTGSKYRGLSAGYIFGKPTQVRLSKEEYQQLRAGNFTWANWTHCNPTFSNTSTTWGKAGIIVTNISKTTINDRYEGTYMGVTDNSQMNPATDFDSLTGVFSVSENSTDLTLRVPETRLNFPLSGTATSNDNSISESLEGMPTFNIDGTEFDDTLIVGLFKLRTSVYSTDTIKLDYVLAEGYTGSIDSHRRLQNAGGGNPETFFLGDVEKASGNIEIFVNPYISYHPGAFTNPQATNPTKFARVLTRRAILDSQTAATSANFGAVPAGMLNDLLKKGMQPADSLVPLGYYQPTDTSTRVIGGVPAKLSRIFRSIENLDLVNIDVTVESGLGTIFSSAQLVGSRSAPAGAAGGFDDEQFMNIGVVDHDGSAAPTGIYAIKENGVLSTDATHGYNMIQKYRAVHTEFVTFAEDNRKDHLHIADPPRHIFVQGENDKVMAWDKRRTFTQFVYWPLRHVYSATNSSYCSVFGNWIRKFDGSADKLMWCPFSGTAAATLANNDTSFGPWYAPAGFTRGRFAGATDIGVIPSQKHRDQLYKINVNPVTNFPGEGFVIFGQKTLFKKPSAFDRINVRRLFLHLEKLVRQSMKFYVFEPNNLLTRTSVLNNLTPQFERIKNSQGMFDYLIICDERNNGPSTIDANELVVDIYVKPVRAAEIILVNFYATRSGQDFNEIIS
mgnify:FL=1